MMRPFLPVWASLLMLLVLPVAADPMQSAMQNYQQGKFQLAREQFAKLIKNNSQAQYLLAQMFRLGQGGEADIEQAFNLYQQAADNGHIHAQRNIATIHYYGKLNDKPDYDRALQWFNKAAENNDAWSQWYLAIMYQNGEGVDKDLLKAYQWASIAARNGHREALAMQSIVKQQMNLQQLHQAKLFLIMLDRAATTNPVDEVEKPKTDKVYTAQVAVFRSSENAQRYSETVRQKLNALVDAQMVSVRHSITENSKTSLYQVLVKRFDKISDAVQLCRQIRKQGLDCFATKL